VIEIRSYRRVFDLERRIYSVDRLRLNPGGVPVRGVVYFLALLASVLLAASAPLVGGAARALPWYLRDVALPGVGATVLSVVRLEGRTFHLSAYALLRSGIGPRRLVGMQSCATVGRRWHPGEIVFLPDGSDGHLRRLRYTGPGAVLVAVEHERRGRAIERERSGIARPGWRSALTLSETSRGRALARGEVISLGPATRLRVRASRRSGARR
jgi:hypothetical protein